VKHMYKGESWEEQEREWQEREAALEQRRRLQRAEAERAEGSAPFWMSATRRRAGVPPVEEPTPEATPDPEPAGA